MINIKKVFLDNLPRWESGTNKGKINWKASVGCKVKFIYDNIEGKIEIIEFSQRENNNRRKSYLNIKYNNNIFSISTQDLSKCSLGELLGKFTKKYKYTVGQIVETKVSRIKILEQIRIPIRKDYSKRGYKYQCLTDGNIDQIGEFDLIKGSGCNVCCIPSKKILKNYNDLWTTHREIALLLKYPEEGFKISSGNNSSRIFICPECGFEKLMIINNVIKQGFACSKCGDGVSYPNKFVRNFLEQLNEEYIPEYSPDWAYVENNSHQLNGKKRYDNLLSTYNEIWEVHGIQHYKENNRYNKTLKEEQENDKLKKELADKNGYKYIEIDAKYSNMEYIKISLLNLPETQRYDLTKVDWLKCHEYACSTLIKVACDYWNKGIKSTIEIANIMNTCYSTITKYLKQGVELGWCTYNTGKRKVIQLSLDGDFIKEFISINEAERQTKISQSTISSCCRNKKGSKTAGNYRWIYLEDSYKNDIKSFDKYKIIIQLTLEYEFIKEFKSIREIKRYFKIDTSGIYKCCRNEQKSAGGYKWMYKKDYENYLKQQNLNSKDCEQQSFSFV